MDKLTQAIEWVKQKWLIVAAVFVGLVALFAIKPKRREIQSAKENAKLDAKIYNLSQATSKKLDDEVERIDNETAAKVTKLRNSKKKTTEKFKKQKESRIKELSKKTPEELANLLKPKKD